MITEGPHLVKVLVLLGLFGLLDAQTTTAYRTCYVCVCVCKSTDGSQVSICVNWTDRIDRGIIILSTRHFIYIRAGLPGSVALEVHTRS